MNDRLRFDVNDNQGRFVFPNTRFGPLLEEFEEVHDAYGTDEISETSYINKLRYLAQREPDFIDIHAHLAYAFLEQPRWAIFLFISVKSLLKIPCFYINDWNNTRKHIKKNKGSRWLPRLSFRSVSSSLLSRTLTK